MAYPLVKMLADVFPDRRSENIWFFFFFFKRFSLVIQELLVYVLNCLHTYFQTLSKTIKYKNTTHNHGSTSAHFVRKPLC